MFALDDGTWTPVSVRLPDKAGEYRVVRRGLGGRPRWEDLCDFVPATDKQPACWKNFRGVTIQTVEWWKETDA